LRQFWIGHHDPSARLAARQAGLLDAGFASKAQAHTAGGKAYVASACDFTFHHGPVRNVLEIHWDFVPRFFAIRIPLRNCWLAP